MKYLLTFLAAAALSVGVANAQQTPVGIGDLPAASALSNTDLYVVCQTPPCSAGTQLKAGNVGQIRGLVSGLAPLTYNGTTGALGLAIDSTLSVVSGQLHVVSGGGGGGTVTSILFNSPLTGGTVTTTGTVGLGNIPVTNLNSGTGATSSTFWRGDGIWATPAGGGGGVTSLTQGSGITLTPNPIIATGTVACTTFGTALVGCVPASGGGTTNFLRADGTWAAPPGSGGVTIPTASLLNGNGSVLGSVALGTNLTLTGSFPSQTLNATAGGSGLSGMTATQVPIAATASTVTSSLPLSGTTGATQVASATSAPKIAGHQSVYDANGNLIDGGAPGSGGTVTSATLSSPGGVFAVTGTNPITTSGTFGYSTSGTSGGALYFSSASQVSSSAALTASQPVIGGGPGVAPSTGTRSGNTTQFVTTTGTQTAGNCVQIDGSGNHVPSGFGCVNPTPTASYGTFNGVVNAYTMVSPTPAVTSNVDGYRVCGFFPNTLAENTGDSTFAAGSAPALHVRVKSANGGAILLSGKELLHGTNGNPYCMQLAGSAGYWVLDSQAPGGQTFNPTSPYSITQGDWASQGFFFQDAASTTYNLPASATVSGQAGITIVTGGVQTTQLCATGSDTINGGSAAGCVSLQANTVFPVALKAAGSFVVPVPNNNKAFTTAWAPGQNLSGVSFMLGHIALSGTVNGLYCRPETLVGGTATLNFRFAASGAACATGTLISTTPCNLNTGATSGQQPTITTPAIPANSDICAEFPTGAGWAASVGSGGAQVLITQP